MTDPQQALDELLAWRPPAWDDLKDDAWTSEAWRATQLAGAALTAIRDGYRARGTHYAHPETPLAEVVKAIAGEVELQRAGPWDGGRSRYLGAGPADVAGLLREFDELLRTM